MKNESYTTYDYWKVWQWIIIITVLATTILLLRQQGRLWICSCGYVYLWSGDIWSSDNSQHLLDPYSFTHLLHGIVFFWMTSWIFPVRSVSVRFSIAVSIEALWEIVENSEVIIRRYREGTISLGYEGDTIVNSLGDIVICGIGFLLTSYLGFRRSLILFIVTEVMLLIWIRDSLILNIVMIISPIEAIKAWQAGL